MITTAQGTFGVLLVPKKCPALVNIKTVVSVRQVASGGGATDVGRPNISGHADLDTTFVGNSLIFGASGAFSAGSLEDDGIYATYKSDASVKRHGVFDLSADRSSGYYGRSSAVQPASIRLLPCVKT